MVHHKHRLKKVKIFRTKQLVYKGKKNPTVSPKASLVDIK